jgi:2',3'-cyclic-nucleotide 2'-phosphodiesterase (5'-nucleotidase family)
LSPLDNHNGGFAHLAAAIRRKRANCHDCILLNAGDLMQGTPVSTIFHGLPVRLAQYPVVSSNLVNLGGQLFAKPCVILKVIRRARRHSA